MVQTYTYEAMGTSYRTLAAARKGLKRDGWTSTTARREGIKISKREQAFTAPGTFVCWKDC